MATVADDVGEGLFATLQGHKSGNTLMNLFWEEQKKAFTTSPKGTKSKISVDFVLIGIGNKHECLHWLHTKHCTTVIKVLEFEINLTQSSCKLTEKCFSYIINELLN